jgi:FkbM family methyltransferase
VINKIKKIFKNQALRFIASNMPKSPGNNAFNLCGDSYWFASPNLWEPSVLLALRDLCQPGMVVFDVGANFGGVTSAMSRLVGPMGTVCAFEASPRIIGYLQGNVVAQGHRNVTVYHRAVFSESNKSLKVFEGGHLNDSIFEDQSPTKVGHLVRTLALDDFCGKSNLVPDLVKMDIEGAEYDALKGFVETIQKKRPHLILEQQNSDIRCFEFLKEFSYLFLDLSSYQEIKTTRDFKAGKNLMNVLAVHKTRIGNLPYLWPPEIENICEIGQVEVIKKEKHLLILEKKALPQGRYLFDCQFQAAGTKNNMVCLVECNGRTIFRYNAYSKLLAETYTDWVVDVPFAGDLSIRFEFLDGTSDDSFVFHRIKVKKIKGLLVQQWPSIVLE